jgi:replicative DNA helicase
MDPPNAAECKVLGYMLLSKPAIDKDIEPLMVGCVYYNGKTQKYYLRFRKLMFYSHYIQNFITLDQLSGQ